MLTMDPTTGGTQVLIQTPCEALRPFVERFLVAESTTAHRDAHLPATGLVAAFRFRGACRLDGGAEAPRAAITGLWDTQPHFIKDFKRFTGVSPGAFFGRTDG